MIAATIRRLKAARILARTYGARGLFRRAAHEARRRCNRYRAAPHQRTLRPQPVTDYSYAPGSDWARLDNQRQEAILARAGRVLGGQYQAYGDAWLTLPAGQDEWHRDPHSEVRFASRPWWQIELMPAGADVKHVWEPARFAWVYDLVRAHALSGDPQYGDAFYRIAADWSDANPPFSGPHWACGQETAIRALALLHGLDSLPAARSQHAARSTLEQLLGWSGERIADAIGYGLSQRNNHGISESAGLIHLGLRLRGSHKDAARWLTRGSGWLEEQVIDQFASDGWYAQHSFNYMRVALDQALLAQRRLVAAGLTLSERAVERLKAALRLLSLVVDGDTGLVPNHGANDGARVLPLSATAYRDFRPTLTLGAHVTGFALPADIAPDAETGCWLGADPLPAAPRRSSELVRGASGWVVARLDTSMVFMFAGRYRHRPAHLDALHVHLWMDGCEVIADPGTYSYNAAAPWQNGLASALVHNGPVLDQREPAARGPRFLWLQWPEAEILDAALDNGRVRIVAERPGAVRRELSLAGKRLTVTDRCLDPGARSMQVCWLLHPDVAARVQVAADGARQLPVDDAATVGWYSPTYGTRRASEVIGVRRDVSSGDDVIESVIGWRVRQSSLSG